jgi:O-antigen/teichoic acid export membrane protein
LNPIENIIKTGIKWSAFAQIIIQFIKIARWFILLYFISPEEFGLFALALLVVGLPQILIDEGMSSSIVQSREKLTETDLSSFHWSFVLYSLVLFILYFLIANSIALFFQEPTVAPLIMLIAGANLVESFGKTSHALLRKALNFKEIAKIETAAFFIGTVVTLLLAVQNYNAFALVFGLLTSYLFSMASYYRTAQWHPQIILRIKSFKKIYIFTRNLTVSRIVTYLMRYLDDFIIGYFFGKAALGIYDRAYQIVHLPMRLIANRVNAVLFPTYSAVEDNFEKIKIIHLKIIQYATYFYFPILVSIIILSKPLVILFLPQNWIDLSFFMPVLAVGGTVHAFINFNESIFLAKGRSDLQLKYCVLTRSIIVISYLIGATFGLKYIAIGYTIGSIIAFFPESIRSLQQIDISIYDFWLVIKDIFYLAIVALIIGFIGFYFIDEPLYQLVFGSMIVGIKCLFIYQKFYLQANVEINIK